MRYPCGATCRSQVDAASRAAFLSADQSLNRRRANWEHIRRGANCKVLHVQWFHGGLVVKAHRRLYRSTLGLRVPKKKKKHARDTLGRPAGASHAQGAASHPRTTVGSCKHTAESHGGCSRRRRPSSPPRCFLAATSGGATGGTPTCARVSAGSSRGVPPPMRASSPTAPDKKGLPPYHPPRNPGAHVLFDL